MPSNPRTAKLSKSDYNLVAREHRLKFSGDLPKNAKEKAVWICLCCTNPFSCRYDSLKSSKLQGCPTCTRNNTKHPNSNDEVEYNRVAKEKRLSLIDPAPRTTADHVRWKCLDCAAIFKTNFQCIKRRTLPCLSCAQNSKVKLLLLQVRKFSKCVPKLEEPTDYKQSILWICAKGHEFRTSADNILQGRHCTKCGREKTSEKRRNKREDYKKLAAICGLKIIGKIPSAVRIKTDWCCLKCKIEFSSSFNKLQRSLGCPACNKKRAIDSSRSSPQQYEEAGRKYMWKWLGPIVENQRQFTAWLCEKEGHGTFQARLSHIQEGTGCTKCGYERSAVSQRCSASQYHKLAKLNRCTWLGESVPKNAKAKTTFRCWGENPYKTIHTFQQSYQKLLRSKSLAILSKLSACTRCSAYRRQSNPQEAVFALLKGDGRRYREKKVGKYWIDIVLYVKDRKIAVEYDGWHFHKNKLEKDRIKRAFLRSQGFLTMRIKGGQDVPTKMQLQNAISKLLSKKSTRSWVEIVLPGWGK